jgi:hypothetical protein
MARQHRCRHTLDLFPTTDVAHVVLALQLLGKGAQAVLAAGEQHQLPGFAGQGAGDRLADATRRAGDDGYAVACYRQTFT